MNLSHSTISRLWQKFQQTGSVENLPRRSRGRVTSRVQDNIIRTTHLRNRRQQATTTAAVTIGTHDRPISPQTVINRLREHGIRAHRSYVGPVLTPRHRQARLRSCAIRRRWTMREWSQVLFTDESRFTLQKTDGRVRVYRRRGERYTDACVTEADRFRRGSVMVWGGIKMDGKLGLVIIPGNLNAQTYRQDVLQNVVVPYVNGHANHVVFQQDNARPHVARVNMRYLQNNNIDVLEWPSVSPDLSPIEHLWDKLDRRIRRRLVQLQTLQALTQALIQEWAAIPMITVRRLIRSMRRRCVSVINARGGHTRY